MSKFATVVIGGGTGFVGSYLAEAFRDFSQKVILISRMPGVGSLTWNDVAKNGLPGDTEIVINVAGQNVLDPTKRWTSSFQQKVIFSRVNTTKTLAEAIGKANKPPQAFISISGVGFYPPSVKEEYNEDSNPKSKDFFSTLCRAWEEAANLGAQSLTRSVIIRCGVVLGRDGGMIKQVYLPFMVGLGGPIGSGNQFFPWIHIDDLVNMFVYAAQKSDVQGVLNGVAPQIITNREFAKALAKAMKRPALIPLPETIVNLIFGYDRGTMMTQGQLVVPKRVLDYGFSYKFPDIESACIDLVK